MKFLRKLFHHYRFEDLPPETQEVILDAEERRRTGYYEDILYKDDIDSSKNIPGARYKLEEHPNYLRDREFLEQKGFDLTDLDKIVALLLLGYELPCRYKIRELKGGKKGQMGCYLKDDLVLFYQIDNKLLVLMELHSGTHKHVLGK